MAIPKIFESPDGGKTIYARNAGEVEREMIRENPGIKATRERVLEDQMWHEIRQLAKTQPALQHELDRVIIVYNLIKDQWAIN